MASRETGDEMSNALHDVKRPQTLQTRRVGQPRLSSTAVLSTVRFQFVNELPDEFVPISRAAAENPVDGSRVKLNPDHPFDSHTGVYILCWLKRGDEQVPVGSVRILRKTKKNAGAPDRLYEVSAEQHSMEIGDFYIDQLFVSPSNQGMGVGKVLLCLAVIFSLTRGAKRIYSDPVADPDWIQFFLSLGFVEVERVHCHFVKGLRSGLMIVRMDGHSGKAADPHLLANLTTNYRQLLAGLHKIKRFGASINLEGALFADLQKFILKIYLPDWLEGC